MRTAQELIDDLAAALQGGRTVQLSASASGFVVSYYTPIPGTAGRRAQDRVSGADLGSSMSEGLDAALTRTGGQ